MRPYCIPYSIKEDSGYHERTDTDEQVFDGSLPRIISENSLTKKIHEISCRSRPGEKFLPVSCTPSSGRPCAAQIPLVPLNDILDKGKNEKSEYDCGNRKDHIFDRSLTVLVAGDSI